MAAKVKNPVLKLPMNTHGRDFVVGDIHGCFDQVLRAMKNVGFNPACDRIIGVGDNIDRGPDSHRSAGYLAQPWIKSTRGNHEDMVLEAYEHPGDNSAILRFMSTRNGFGWWLDTPENVRQEILKQIIELPIIIEVETPRGLVGFVHADIPAGMSWQEFKASVIEGDEKTIETALWGRSRIKDGDESGVRGIGRVFVGHTPVGRPVRLGNVYAVDTGAVYGVMDPGMETAMSFVDIATKTMVIERAAEEPIPENRVIALFDEFPETGPFSRFGQ